MSETAAQYRPANPHRGEASIAISGKPYVLRPSFEALVATEAELGSLFALVERASAGSLAVSEIASILWHCLPPEARPDKSQVGEAVMAMGLIAATQPVRAIFAQILKGSG